MVRLQPDFSQRIVLIRFRHELFVYLWKDKTDYTGVMQSPLVAFLQHFKFAAVVEKGFGWDYKVDEQTVMGYVGQVIAWIRLTWLKEPNGGFDGVEYWAKKILLFDSLPEDWYATCMRPTLEMRDVDICV